MSEEKEEVEENKEETKEKEQEIEFTIMSNGNSSNKATPVNSRKNIFRRRYI